ncbi:hypothetical protein JCM4914_63090 [Streptomyces platensis subsp. malvinus]
MSLTPPVPSARLAVSARMRRLPPAITDALILARGTDTDAAPTPPTPPDGDRRTPEMAEARAARRPPGARVRSRMPAAKGAGPLAHARRECPVTPQAPS